ncbi:efflux RND transporter periplasmic adaptor subunit [Ostreiculturibacter nitratireducens]|uniref:efflux RND transporter periplasmic adaptor subunit n=1 Tax=Ostreiculturibacter nitratireducens TaxID=3075226 RepID=UPI0031B57E21
MRVLPLITAALVMATLYLLVFERDRLLVFAAREAPASEAAPETAEAPVTTEAEAPAVSVVAIRSSAQSIDSAVLLRGETEAARQVEVRAETGGKVISSPLRRGAKVAEGDPLCAIDPGTRPAALAEAEARLPEAEARLEEARARVVEAQINANAAERLSEGGFASDARVAGAEASLVSARAGVRSAEATLRAAEAAVEAALTEMERTRIAAPFAGFLETDAAETGALLSAGGLCATVVALDPIKLVGFVPETEVDRVTLGAMAGARLVTGKEVVGRVTFLSRAADPNTRTFRVEVEVANPDLSIRDGQTAEILISAEGGLAHLLPSSALTLDDEGRLGVRTVDAGRAGFAPVEILRDTAEGVWVGGLPEEAEVIVVGQEYVTEGVPVAVTYREPG